MFGCKNSPPWTTVFLLNHIFLVVTAWNSISSWVHRSTIYSHISTNVLPIKVLFCIDRPHSSHISFAQGHSQRMCKTVSSFNWQKLQQELWTIPCFFKLAFVGRILLQARQRNIFTRFGTFIPQIDFQKLLHREQVDPSPYAFWTFLFPCGTHYRQKIRLLLYPTKSAHLSTRIY